MGEERNTTAVGIGAGMPSAAATGIVAVGGLIPLMAVAGGWWLMAAALAALLATLVVVVLMIMRVLDQSGDAVPAAPAQAPEAAPAPRPAALVLRAA